MHIDIHVHTSRITGPKRGNGSRFPTPEELISMMDKAGIGKAVLMCTISPEFRFNVVTSEEVLQMCEAFPDRLIPFAGIDPRMLTNSVDSDFSEMLNHYKACGCKGIGEYFPNIPFDDPLNLNVFKQVEEAGLPLTFHVATQIGETYGVYDDPGLPRLENVLKSCPDLVFLGHSQAFWAEIDANVTAENRGGYPTGPVTPGRVVELMRTYPNLHGDLSAGSGCNAIARDLEFGLQFMEEFQDRLYFGTDIANTEQKLPLVDLFKKLKTENLVSESVYDKISWQNASRLLKLEA